MKNKVNKIIEKIRPYIKMHGGDVSLISVKNGIVTIQISGACSHCSLSDITYNKMLGGIIKEEVPEINEIIIQK